MAQRFAADHHLKAGRHYEAALVMAMPAAFYAGYDEILRLAFILGAATVHNAKETNQIGRAHV